MKQSQPKTFIEAAEKLLNSPQDVNARDYNILSDHLYGITIDYRNVESKESLGRVSREHQIDFLLLVAVVRGELTPSPA